MNKYYIFNLRQLYVLYNYLTQNTTPTPTKVYSKCARAKTGPWKRLAEMQAEQAAAGKPSSSKRRELAASTPTRPQVTGVDLDESVVTPDIATSDDEQEPIITAVTSGVATVQPSVGGKTVVSF